MGIIFVETILYPAWIRADAGGVTVWNSFRRRVFPWSEIRGFELGNPNRPEIAYLLRGYSNQVVPVELPDLHDPSPTDVVRLLSKRRAGLDPTRSERGS
jgi:hypothetical protein